MDPSVLLNFFFFFGIYLAVSGLSCGTRDLRCGMQNLLLLCAGFSLVVALRLQSAWAQVALQPVGS